MAQRTDTQILNDIALGNTTLEDEKGINPQNFNLILLMEVMLNIREHLVTSLEKLDELKVELVEIKNNTAS